MFKLGNNILVSGNMFGQFGKERRKTEKEIGTLKVTYIKINTKCEWRAIAKKK